MEDGGYFDLLINIFGYFANCDYELFKWFVGTKTEIAISKIYEDGLGYIDTPTFRYCHH